MIHHLYDIGPFRVSIDSNIKRLNDQVGVFRVIDGNSNKILSKNKSLHDAINYCYAHCAAVGEMAPKIKESVVDNSD